MTIPFLLIASALAQPPPKTVILGTECTETQPCNIQPKGVLYVVSGGMNVNFVSPNGELLVYVDSKKVALWFSGAGPPERVTGSRLLSFYFDETARELWMCTNKSVDCEGRNPANWVQVGSGGPPITVPPIDPPPVQSNILDSFPTDGPLGSSWLPRLGQFIIKGGSAVGQGAGANGYDVAEWIATKFGNNYAVSVIFRGGAYPGPASRVSAVGGYTCGALAGWIPAESQLFLTTFGQSQRTLANKIPATIPKDAVITVESIGNEHKCFVNGVEVLRATDNTFPTGAPGIVSSTRNNGTLDDFRAVAK